jgi:tetratricopeptide (TPR) repeat protein
MHKILFLLFFITCSLSVNAGNSSPLLDSANIAYAKKDFTRAISLYEKELSLDQEAPELYYNLGNAYFKNNNIPMAILNYERAKKLKPEDEDLEVNLKLANQQIADKMDGAEIHFLSVWKNRMLNTCSERAWSLWSIGAWVAGIAFLSLYFLSSRMICASFS